MTDSVLTIDLGTSGPKVALFTLNGDFIDGEFTPVTLHHFPGGGVEQSPTDWWDGIIACSQRLFARTPALVDDIGAVAVTSQWSGTVPVDRDGEPLHDAIIWMDARGADVTREKVGGRIRVGKPVSASFQMQSKPGGPFCLRVSGAVAPSAPARKPVSPDVAVLNR